MEHIVEMIWNPYLLLFFLGVGIYLSLLSGFFQGKFPLWWKGTIGHKDTKSQVTALFTALATTIGTGSIAGVATAIWFGGAGAVFWMWVSAFFGMMISACEKILTIEYRKEIWKDQFVGGPMYYMERGLGWHFLAKFYAVACLFATLIGGNLVQSSAIAQGMHHLFSLPKLWVGFVLMALVFLALKGGLDYVGKISNVLVPLMATIYLGAGLFCILQDLPTLWTVWKEIFRSAFSTEAVLGGGMYTAIRYGMARGIFSNEAGLGASAMAHGNAKVDHPARQGLWGIVEVFFATMIVCTLTALVILTSGIYTHSLAQQYLLSGEPPPIPIGVPMTQAAFSVLLGQWGSGIVLFSLILFAFTSILGWSCYGAQCLSYLTRNQKAQKLYYVVTAICIFWGSKGETASLWLWVDFSIIWIAIPNLLALVCLAPKAIGLLEDWNKREPLKRK
ncbi:MAG: amino acid carrier protein [Eubacteriales bacterium]